MTSKTGICNLAIGHLGILSELGNVDSDQSAEASACRRFYEATRDELLRKFQWSFATKIQALGLVEENPNTEWRYSYQYPSDCFLFRRILSGLRVDSRQSRVPYRLAHGAAGRVIFTDMAEAFGEWTLRITDSDRFPPDFTTAFSFLLASRIAPAISAGDPFGLGEKAFQQYRLAIGEAMAMGLLEEQVEEDPDSEFGRFR